jgi:heme oxygenase
MDHQMLEHRVAPHQPELSMPVRPAMGSLRQLLREQTHEVHTELEQATILNQRIAERPRTEIKHINPPDRELTLDLQRNEYRSLYGSFLLVAHALERGFEARIEDEPRAAALLRGIGIQLEEPRATTLIARDLNELGVTASLRTTATLPEAVTLHELIGLQYVRIGSRLGGTMISKIVELNLGSEVPRHFLRSHGVGVKQAVEKTFAAFDKVERSASGDADAIRTARATFQAIKDWQVGIEQALCLPSKPVPTVAARLWGWLTH